jgi:hypothetical protein
MNIMIEKYILIYLFITLIFSYIVAFYLRVRFPGPDEQHRLQDLQKIKILQHTKIQKILAQASLYKNNRLMATLFIFLFNVAIPVVGYIFTLWLTWYLTHVKYEKKIVFTNILDLDEFKNTFMKIERIFGESSMINLLNNDYVPKSKKLRALATLAATPSPASLSIIKQTLSSSDDEIRLYGYSILNNLEKKINSRINQNLQFIHEKAFKEKSKEEEKQIAQAAMDLAFSYWELVYMELSHESLKNNFLNSAINYIELAKEFFIDYIEELSDELERIKKNPLLKKELYFIEEELQEAYEKASNLYTLMGRIFLYRESYEQAQAEFTIAKELLPEDSTTIVPYLAEVYFNVKKYSITKSVLNQYDSLRFNAKLYPIVKQWERQSA